MEWIKVEKATARKVEVIALASILGIHPDHAFGLCFRFWSWCDEALQDGHARGMTLCALDAIFGHPGFVPALVEVGWLNDRNGALEVPNFDRHLSQSAKNRALAAERAKTSRVTRTSRAKRDAPVTKSAPEERREEKRRKHNGGSSQEATITGPPPPTVAWHQLPVTAANLEERGVVVPQSYHDDRTRDRLAEWIGHLQAKGHRWTPHALNAKLRQATGAGMDREAFWAAIDANIGADNTTLYLDAHQRAKEQLAVRKPSGARKSGSELVAEIMGDD